MSLGPSGLSTDFCPQALPWSVLSLVWSAVAEGQEDRRQASFLEQACLGPSLHSLVRRSGGMGTGCIPLVPEGRTDGSSCGSAQAPLLPPSPPRVVCVPGCDSEQRVWMPSLSCYPILSQEGTQKLVQLPDGCCTWRPVFCGELPGLGSEVRQACHFVSLFAMNKGCSDLRDKSDQISLS